MLKYPNLSDVTVIVLTRNRTPYIFGLLRYLKNQPFKIIVGDGSDDDSTKIVCDSHGVQYVKHESLNERLNLIEPYLTTKYSLFCSDDDLVSFSGVDKAIKFLNKTKVSYITSGRNFNDFFLDGKRNKIRYPLIFKKNIKTTKFFRIALANLKHEHPWYSVWKTSELRKLLRIFSDARSQVLDFYDLSDNHDNFMQGLMSISALFGPGKVANHDIFLIRAFLPTKLKNSEWRHTLIPFNSKQIKFWINAMFSSASSNGLKINISQEDFFDLLSRDLVDRKKRENHYGFYRFFNWNYHRGVEWLYVKTRKLQNYNFPISVIGNIMNRVLVTGFLFRNIISLKRIPWSSRLVNFNPEIREIYLTGALPKHDLRKWFQSTLSPTEHFPGGDIYTGLQHK